MNIAFQHPSVLWALLLILIPILLHLFNLQVPKVIYFSNNRFLKKIISESQKSSTLKRLLLLISRIFVIGFLVLAFAKPFIHENKISKSETTALYIDNSFSMSAVSNQGKALDYAKTIATSIVNGSARNAKFWIADNDNIYANKTPTDKTKSNEAISEIGISGANGSINRSISKLLWKAENDVSQIIIITDGQRQGFDIAEIEDTAVAITIINIETQNNGNISIDSCWFSSPFRKHSNNEEITVEIQNYNADEREIPLQLYINDSLKSLAKVVAKPGKSEHIVSFYNPKGGEVNIKVEIEDYPIEFDNTYYIAYKLSNKIRIAQLYESSENKSIKAMYNQSAHIEYSSAPILSFLFADINEYDLIVIENSPKAGQNSAAVIGEYIAQGGNVLIIPNADPKVKEWIILETLGVIIDSIGTKPVQISTFADKEELFSASLGTQNSKSYNLGTIDAPIYHHSKHTKQRNLLTLKNGRPVFSLMKHGKGQIYFSGITFNDKNREFISSPIISPLLYNIALHSEKTHYSNTTIGSDCRINLKNTDETRLSISNSEKSVSYAPEYRTDRFNNQLIVLPNKSLSKSGKYILEYGKEKLPLALNYSRAESQLEYVEDTDIFEINKRLPNVKFIDSEENISFELNSGLNQNSSFWRVVLALAILFLFIEKLIIRLI